MRATAGQEILLEAIDRAWNSPAFKKELIDDPEEVLRDISNNRFEAPLGYSLEFFDRPDIDIADLRGEELSEELPGRILRVNIPRKPDLSAILLTEEQLEIVSAGTSGSPQAQLIRYFLLPLLLI